jgi:hypothetical protein
MASVLSTRVIKESGGKKVFELTAEGISNMKMNIVRIIIPLIIILNIFIQVKCSLQKKANFFVEKIAQ